MRAPSQTPAAQPSTSSTDYSNTSGLFLSLSDAVRLALAQLFVYCSSNRTRLGEVLSDHSITAQRSSNSLADLTDVTVGYKEKNVSAWCRGKRGTEDLR